MTNMRIAIEGLGVVGARVARELVTTPGVDMTVVGADLERFTAVDKALGGGLVRGTRGSEVDRVILSGTAGDHVAAARHWLGRGIDVVSMGDDLGDIEELLALDGVALANDATVVVGVAASPGLTCVLTRHAAGLLDVVTEVHVASFGAGGVECLRHRQRQLTETAREWRDGEWLSHPGGSGKELCWFPDPLGARDCARGALAEPVLATRAFDGIERATARAAVTGSDRILGFLPRRNRAPVEAEPGAVRVDVRGRAGVEPTTVVYAVLDRLSVAAAATAAALVVGWADHDVPTGAHGLAEFVRPLPMLSELARRGVKAATLSTTP